MPECSALRKGQRPVPWPKYRKVLRSHDQCSLLRSEFVKHSMMHICVVGLEGSLRGPGRSYRRSVAFSSDDVNDGLEVLVGQCTRLKAMLGIPSTVRSLLMQACAQQVRCTAVQ